MRPRCSEADESFLARFEGSPVKCLSPAGERREILPASLHPRCRGAHWSLSVVTSVTGCIGTKPVLNDVFLP